jgi:hypothetical protein
MAIQLSSSVTVFTLITVSCGKFSAAETRLWCTINGITGLG